jgi:hypothetical protein
MTKNTLFFKARERRPLEDTIFHLIESIPRKGHFGSKPTKFLLEQVVREINI